MHRGCARRFGNGKRLSSCSSRIRTNPYFWGENNDQVGRNSAILSSCLRQIWQLFTQLYSAAYVATPHSGFLRISSSISRARRCFGSNSRAFSKHVTASLSCSKSNKHIPIMQCMLASAEFSISAVWAHSLARSKHALAQIGIPCSCNTRHFSKCSCGEFGLFSIARSKHARVISTFPMLNSAFPLR